MILWSMINQELEDLDILDGTVFWVISCTFSKTVHRNYQGQLLPKCLTNRIKIPRNQTKKSPSGIIKYLIWLTRISPKGGKDKYCNNQSISETGAQFSAPDIPFHGIKATFIPANLHLEYSKISAEKRQWSICFEGRGKSLLLILKSALWVSSLDKKMHSLSHSTFLHNWLCWYQKNVFFW